MSVDEPPVTARWRNYVMESGDELHTFWRAHLRQERHILFVLGKGFDPRVCLGLRSLLAAGGAGRRDVIAVEFDEGPSSPSKAYGPLVEENWAALQALVAGKGTLSASPVKIWSDDGRRIGARSAAALFLALSDLRGYTDIVVDISALPRGIYFPLIAKILHLLDSTPEETGNKPNLHVIVAESPLVDRCIQDEGIDETATYLHPFGASLEMEATADHPKVWIPVLGERQGTQLVRIYDLVMPDEIAPVLPSPSVNPRRSDDLLLEYRELLFDRLRVEPGNFIYASERNPFEVYRQIGRAVFHYREALQPLGGCKVVLSALSSKLLSLGTLLVAYELKQKKVEVGVGHVECQGYTIESAAGETGGEAQSELFGLWIAGECYEP